MLVLIVIFAGVHSGMAAFRQMGEELVGERLYRVLFAGISLPLATTTVVSLALYTLMNIKSLPFLFLFFPLYLLLLTMVSTL